MFFLPAQSAAARGRSGGMGGGMGRGRYISIFIFLLLVLNLFIYNNNVNADVRSYDLTSATVFLNTSYRLVVSNWNARAIIKPASWIIPQEIGSWCYVDKDICFIYTIRNLFYIIAASKTIQRQITTVYSVNLNTILPSAHTIPTGSDTITASYILTTPFRDGNNRTIYALIVLSARLELTGATSHPAYSYTEIRVRDMIFRFIPFVFTDTSISFITSMIATYQDTRTLTTYALVYSDGRGASILFFSLIDAAVNEYSDFVIKYVLISSNYDYRLYGQCPYNLGSACNSVSFVFSAAVISQINSSSVFITVNPGPAMSYPNPGGYRFNGVLPISFLLTDKLQAGIILMTPQGFIYAVVYNDISSGYQLNVFGPWPYKSLDASKLQFYTAQQNLCLFNRLMHQYTINSPPQFYLSYSETRPNSGAGVPGKLVAVFLVPQMDYISPYSLDYYATGIDAQAYQNSGSVDDGLFSSPLLTRYYIYKIGDNSRKLCKAQYYDYFREFGYDWLYAPAQDIYAPQLVLMVWNSDRTSNDAYLYNFKMSNYNPSTLINVLGWGSDYIVVDDNGAIVLLTMQPVQQAQRTDTPAVIQPPGGGGGIPTLTVTAPPAPGAPPGGGALPGGPGWVYDPSFWNIMIFFAILLLPLMFLADRLGMPGALIGAGLGLALGIYIGVVPFWLIILIVLGMLIFLVFARGGGGKE